MVEVMDKYNLVYLMFLAQGVGTLMPWNMFITANDYFVNYKLSSNYTNQDTTAYAQLFLQYLGVISNTPLVVFSWLNLFIKTQGVNLGPRILISIAIEVGLFLLTIILAMVNTSGWPGPFFVITMLTACLLNSVNAIYQNSVFGISAQFPPKYTGGIILGNNISGVLTSLILIISDAVASSKRGAAIYYFITAIFFLMSCFDLYLSFIINKFYRYTHFKAKKEALQAQRQDENDTGKVPYWEIFKKAAPQLYNVFFVFTVTLWTFPAILANIKRYSENFPISDKYFTSVTCFLTFNVFATLGSLLPLLIIWPGPKRLWIPVTLRVLFFPFFILCNYQVLDKTRKLVVLISSDWIYWIGAAAMSFTSGYFSSVGMMYAPGTVEPQHAPIAGMLAGACLVTGVFTGIILSFIGPLLI